MSTSPYFVVTFGIRFFSWELLKEALINFIVFIGVYSRPIIDASTNLRNKRAIVTGGNRGIGKSIVELLAQRGANIVIACRDIATGQATADEISSKNPDSKITVSHCDLKSFDSVVNFANSILADGESVDILVNNAGFIGDTYAETGDEQEEVFQVNCLSPILLASLLSKKIKQSKGVIAGVTSLGHFACKKLDINHLSFFAKHDYNHFLTYIDSKLVLMLATKQLNEILGNDVTCITVDPGAAQTDLFNTIETVLQKIFYSTLMRPFFRTTEGSANSIVQSILNHKDRNKHAIYCYMKDGKYCRPSKLARSETLQKNVWQLMVNSLGSRLTL